MARTAIKIALYTLLFLLSTLVFMYWTFPMEKARLFAEQEARRRLGMDLSIGELTLSGLSGLEATDVVLRFKSKPKTEEVAPLPGGAPKGTLPGTLDGGPGVRGPNGEGLKTPVGAKAGADLAEEAPKAAADAGAGGKAEAAKPVVTTIRVDRLAARVALWDLLFDKHLRVTEGELELFGGRIEGVSVDWPLKAATEPIEVGLERIEALAAAQLPFLEGVLGGPLKGKLSGTLTATIPRPFALITTRGEAQLTLDKAVMPKPELESKQYGKFVLTDVKLGTIKLHVILDEKGKIAALGAKSNDKTVVLYLAELALSGGDIEAQLEERATLTLAKGQGLKEAFMALQGSFRVEPAFFERAVRTDSGSEKPNLFLRTLLTSDQAWKRAEQDGVYGFRCTGKFTAKSCTPTKPVGQVRYSGEARSKRAADDAKAGKTPGKTPAKAPPGKTPGATPGKSLQTPSGDRAAPPAGRRPPPPTAGRPGARPGAPGSAEVPPPEEAAPEEPAVPEELPTAPEEVAPAPEEPTEVPAEEPGVEEPATEGGDEVVPEEGGEGGEDGEDGPAPDEGEGEAPQE